jgi:hypothetical protein
VRTHDAETLPSWAPPLFWFTLKQVNKAGSCPLWHGSVLFVARDQQALTLVLSALAAGHSANVAFDDDLRHPAGYCVVKYITIGNPAPEWH